jgi:hypothetical protein
MSCNIVLKVERGLSHAMIYTSKIIDLDEERAAGHNMRAAASAQSHSQQVG